MAREAKQRPNWAASRTATLRPRLSPPPCGITLPPCAARGKRVFESRGCAKCHGITQEMQPGIQPVSRWQSLNHPFALSEAMWNHMRPMLAVTGAKRVAWPELSSQDLSDLLVYLRNLPMARASLPDFQITLG